MVAVHNENNENLNIYEAKQNSETLEKSQKQNNTMHQQESTRKA